MSATPNFSHRLCIACALLYCALIPGSLVHADLEVHKRQDVVVLEDESEIVCIVLMISPSGVLIVENDPKDPKIKTQRIIPKDRIRQIVRGTPGAIQGLETETEFARKVVKGSGYRDEIAHKEKDKDGKKGKPAVDGDKDLAAPATAKGDKAEDGAQHPGAKGDAQAPLPEGTLSAKDLTDAYLARFPELRGTALDLFGEDRIQEVFDSARNGNKTAQRDLETFLQPFIGASDNGPDNSGGAGVSPSRLDRLNRLKQLRAGQLAPATPTPPAEPTPPAPTPEK